VKATGQALGLLRVVCSSFCVFFAMFAIGWGLNTLPEFWAGAALEQVAVRVENYEPYRLSSMRSTASVFDNSRDSLVEPEVLRATAIVNLRLLEQEFEIANRPALDPQFERLEASLVRSLATEPADPFLWFALYWVKTARFGFTAQNLNYLRLSYLTGPNEGWVAIRRNRYALIAYQFLPTELAEDALNEFVGLVNSGYIDEAAQIFVGPGWAIRDTLLNRLKNAGLDTRQRLAKRIYDLGYDVEVPGATRFGVRPWR